jgi:hypothetical protein
VLTQADYERQDAAQDEMLEYLRDRGYGEDELDHVIAGWEYAMDHEGRVDSPHSIAVDMAEAAIDGENDVASLIHEGISNAVRFFKTGDWRQPWHK